MKNLTDKGKRLMMDVMPRRKTPFVIGEIYHVFNRGINHQNTFKTLNEYTRALETISYYRFAKNPLKLSRFLKLSEVDKALVLSKIQNDDNKRVTIYAYCLMPNHFHFLLKEEQDGGIQNFVSDFQNSYTKYRNTCLKQDGNIFLDQFKAVRVESDEDFLQVSRYIHLNPYASGIAETIEELKKYSWSSFKSYFDVFADEFVDTTAVLAFYKNKQAYENFVISRAGMQKEVKSIQHKLNL